MGKQTLPTRCLPARLSCRRWCARLLEGPAGRSLAICVKLGWDLDWVLIVAHLVGVYCVNSIGLRRRSSATEQGSCSGWPGLSAGWQSGSQAGEPCTRWQQDDGRWRVTSHYISSGSGPLIGARLGISSVVPSGLETFFWATAQMSCHGPCLRVLGPGVGCWGFPQ